MDQLALEHLKNRVRCGIFECLCSCPPGVVLEIVDLAFNIGDRAEFQTIFEEIICCGTGSISPGAPSPPVPAPPGQQPVPPAKPAGQPCDLAGILCSAKGVAIFKAAGLIVSAIAASGLASGALQTALTAFAQVSELVNGICTGGTPDFEKQAEFCGSLVSLEDAANQLPSGGAFGTLRDTLLKLTQSEIVAEARACCQSNPNMTPKAPRPKIVIGAR